jgi:hypothetical protein
MGAVLTGEEAGRTPIALWNIIPDPGYVHHGDHLNTTIMRDLLTVSRYVDNMEMYRSAGNDARNPHNAVRA